MFSHLSSQKQAPVLLPHHSMSDEAVSCTYAHRPLQHLFRPYPKPTPHLYPYSRLRLNNSYYAIKALFDILTNPTLHHQHKPTFWLHHNKLLCHLVSINISQWILHKLCRLLPPSPMVSPPSWITLTSSYKTLLLSIFLLQSFVQNHMSNVQQYTMARRWPM